MSIKINVLKLGVAGLRCMYAPMKLTATKNKITIISRQSNKPSMDIRLISDYIQKNHPEVECKVLCRFLDNLNPISYFVEVFKQMINMASSKVILLDGYCIAASVLNHKAGTEVIQMWHAQAAIKKFGHQTIDKPSGHSRAVADAMCMHRNYTHVIAPSVATGIHLCKCFNADGDKLVFMALPRVDEILRPDTILPEEFRTQSVEDFRLYMREEYKIPADKEIILYVPTFRKGEDVQLSGLADAIDGDRFVLVVKVHPIFKDLEYIPENGDDNLQVIVDTRFTSYQWMSVCDRVVTDYSALGVEAALLNKPLYYYVYDIEDYQQKVGLNLNPLEELPEASAVTTQQLAEIINKEYDFDSLVKFREKYVSVDTSACTKTLAEYLVGLVNGTLTADNGEQLN